MYIYYANNYKLGGCLNATSKQGSTSCTLCTDLCLCFPDKDKGLNRCVNA